METYTPSCILHLAGVASPGVTNQGFVWKTNVDGTLNLVRFAPKGCRFILASSVVVYGDWLMNMSETAQYMETDDCHPTSMYGLSKLTAEKIVNFYTDEGHIDGLSLRLCATVGKGLTHGVLKDFLQKAKSDDHEFKMMGIYPGSTKPYMHINDVVGAFIAAIDSELRLGAINIVPSTSMTINNIAEFVLRLTHKKSQKKKVWLSNVNFAGDNHILRISNAQTKLLVKPQFPTSEMAMSHAIMENLNA